MGHRQLRVLEHEVVGSDVYEYYSLGRYVVSAPGVCRGRPTFKYTRIEVADVLRLLGAGESAEEIVADYSRPELTMEAIREAIQVAVEALLAEAPALEAKAA